MKRQVEQVFKRGLSVSELIDFIEADEDIMNAPKVEQLGRGVKNRKFKDASKLTAPKQSIRDYRPDDELV